MAHEVPPGRRDLHHCSARPVNVHVAVEDLDFRFDRDREVPRGSDRPSPARGDLAPAPPSSFGATKTCASSMSRRRRRVPKSSLPPSTRTLVIRLRPSSARTAAGSGRPFPPPDAADGPHSNTSTPSSRNCAMFSRGALVPVATNSGISRAVRTSCESSGSRAWLSKTMRVATARAGGPGREERIIGQRRADADRDRVHSAPQRVDDRPRSVIRDPFRFARR